MEGEHAASETENANQQQIQPAEQDNQDGQEDFAQEHQQKDLQRDQQEEDENEQQVVLADEDGESQE